MEEKGLARAVGALRAELHSFGLSGARIVIEVTPAQWHHVRMLLSVNGKPSDVEQLELVSDVVNGDVVVRPSPAAESIAKTVEQLADLGLQRPTLEQRMESIEKVMAPRLELNVDTLADVVRRLESLEHAGVRSRGFDFERWKQEVNSHRADLEKRVTAHAVDFPKRTDGPPTPGAQPPLQWQIDQLANRVTSIERKAAR